MSFKLGDWILLLFIAVGTAVLIALGSWQVHRLGEKEAMIARVEANLDAEPIPYDDVLTQQASGADVEYVPVSVTGRFLHDRTQYYFATYKGTTGRYLYTPLQRDDGTFVWVNRGFVPQGFGTPARTAPVQMTGSLTVLGLAREAPGEKPNWWWPDNEPAKNLFFWKDRTAMSAAAGLDPERVLPVFVDAAREGPHAAPAVNGRPGLPIGGVTQVEFPNNHLQYIVTWYGLALTLLLVGGSFLWRRVRDRTISPPTEGETA